MRTTIQEKVSPMTTATAVPAPHTPRELISAACTFGFASTAMKFASDKLPAWMPSTIGLAFVSAPTSSMAIG